MFLQGITDMQNGRTNHFQQLETLFGIDLQPVQFLNELIKLTSRFPHVHDRESVDPLLQLFRLVSAKCQVRQILLGQFQAHRLGWLLH